MNDIYLKRRYIDWEVRMKSSQCVEQNVLAVLDVDGTNVTVLNEKLFSKVTGLPFITVTQLFSALITKHGKHDDAWLKGLHAFLDERLKGTEPKNHCRLYSFKAGCCEAEYLFVPCDTVAPALAAFVAQNAVFGDLKICEEIEVTCHNLTSPKDFMAEVNETMEILNNE